MSDGLSGAVCIVQAFNDKFLGSFLCVVLVVVYFQYIAESGVLTTTIRRLNSTIPPVLPFSKCNVTFLGYFDPGKILLIMKINDYSG